MDSNNETIEHLEKKLDRLTRDLASLTELQDIELKSHRLCMNLMNDLDHESRRTSIKYMQARHEYHTCILNLELRGTRDNYRMALMKQ
jgi:hypothetical protein